MSHLSQMTFKILNPIRTGRCFTDIHANSEKHAVQGFRVFQPCFGVATAAQFRSRNIIDETNFRVKWGQKKTISDKIDN